MGGELNMTRKYLFFAFFLFLIACAKSSDDTVMEHLQMDKRVIAYVGGSAVSGSPFNGFYQVVTDINVLKEHFQKALNEDNFDLKCHYFAINASAVGSLEYFVVSKDSKSDSLAVYKVLPSLTQDNSSYSTRCISNEKLYSYSFLICDKEGGLKDRILPPIEYHDPNWNCAVEYTAIFFEFKPL
jgi:hypothetical protein